MAIIGIPFALDMVVILQIAVNRQRHNLLHGMRAYRIFFTVLHTIVCCTNFSTQKGVIFMTVQPLGDRVLVRRVEEEETQRGGIIIPDTAKEKPQQGEIVAVGEGKVADNGDRTPLEVAVGDKILFGKYSGTEVNLDDEEYLMMREEDILGILK